jgi:hypothetical protein
MAAVVESLLGERVADDVGPRIEAALVHALKSDQFAEVLGPRAIGEALGLSAQAEIAAAPPSERLVTTAAFLGAQRVVQAQVSIDRDGYRITLSALSAADGSLHSARRSGIQSLAGLDALIAHMLGDLRSEPAAERNDGRRAPRATATRTGTHSTGKLTLVAGAFALAGGAAVGSSYLMMGSAQTTFDELPQPVRDDVDSLLGAQSSARMVWGAGLGLIGVGALTWSFAR